MSGFFIFVGLKQVYPELSKDGAISFSALTTRDSKKLKAARMCLLCAISCSCWLVTMRNRRSLHIIFEAACMVLVPFVSGLMKTAFAYYFRQKDVPNSDIETV